MRGSVHGLAPLVAVALLALLGSGTASVANPVAATSADDWAPERVQQARPPGALDSERASVDRYTVDWIRGQIPRKGPKGRARIVATQALPFLPPSNLIEMEPLWRQAGHNEWILLGRGRHTLRSIAEQLNDPKVIRRESGGVYRLMRPIYVAPTAKLSISNGEWLKLSARSGAILISNGDVVIVDSKVTAWDDARGRALVRPPVEKAEARLWAKNTPRPYMLFQSGSRTWLGNTIISNLGYMGGYGSYGLSFSATLTNRSLNRHLRNLPRPRAWLVGNRIEDLFFGIYSNRASQLVIVGNDFDGNLIYGIDPHDHSRGVVIARNLARRTKLSHGIILSRDVSHADIFENISVGNAGSGIVLDRQCRGVRVNRNVAIANQGDGVSLFESGNALLRQNRVLLNWRNGIFSRNSDDVIIRENEAARNGDDGLEITAQALKPGSRNLALDPYRVEGSAWVESNQFDDNARSAISAKGPVEVSIGRNRYVDSGPSYFGGALKAKSAAILLNEPKGNDGVLQMRLPRVER